MFIKFAGRLYNTQYITDIYNGAMHFEISKPDSPIMFYEIIMYHLLPMVEGNGAQRLHTEIERYDVNQHYSYLKRMEYLEKVLCGNQDKA